MRYFNTKLDIQTIPHELISRYMHYVTVMFERTFSVSGM